MAARKRILVACEELILSGGMLRFERLGRALAADQYEMAYACLADHPVAHWPSRFPVLSFTECAAQSWDFVMVPGAGFSDQTIDRLARFRDPRFGRRIQHVLNDQSLKPRFLYVNQTFQPHMVVFNNLAWPPGSYTEFQAEQFHTVLGAVDIDRFRPDEKRSREQPGSTVLGGLANKNAEVLVDALALLPDSVSLKLLGNADALLDARPDVRHTPRIERVGVLFEDDLPTFYRDIDIAVHTEMRGGWSNFAAEAMASGVPLICTPHGTTAFARDGETAVVLGEASPAAVAAAVAKLTNNSKLSGKLRPDARRAIETYSWQAYTTQLMEVAQASSFIHYTCAPEIGLFGKWTLEQRLKGLEPLLSKLGGATVLDLGSAEGLLARECLKCGAAKVIGLEADTGRVAFASNLCREWKNCHFEQADVTDLSHTREILMRHGACFDFVLYLGVHHHLLPGARDSVIDLAIEHVARTLVLRMPERIYEAECVKERLLRSGFSESCEAERDSEIHSAPDCGTLHIWQRQSV